MQDRLTELDRLVNRLDSEWKTQRSKSYVQHLIPKHLLSAPIPNRTGSQGNAAEYAADALTQVMASVLIRAFIKFPEPKDGLKDDRHGNSRGTSLVVRHINLGSIRHFKWVCNKCCGRACNLTVVVL